MKLTLFDLDYDKRQGNITRWPAQTNISGFPGNEKWFLQEKKQ